MIGRRLRDVACLSTIPLIYVASDVSAKTPPKSDSAPDTSNSDNEKPRTAGENGVSLPRCVYMPNPPYTKEAKAAKFEGAVLVEGVINLEGRITNIRVIKSPGLGLDDSVIQALKTERCVPAVDPMGKPIPAIVPLQINFRPKR